MPILCVTGLDGKARAVVANYACHCTTLGGEFNRLCGDWAGFAQEAIQRDFPGALALITIGCGADANPYPRGSLELARQHGEELAAEVRRLLDGHLIPIRQKLLCRNRRFDLPFDTLPTRGQWEERSKQDGIVGYHARRNLERLDRGETLPATLPYFVQTWNFGDQLAMVFLAGEVVVDYSLRLKKEFAAQRLWVTAYANDVPCYVPSQRILREGGYEAETSLWYYDRPTRLAPAIEDLIVGAVRELMPAEFRSDPAKAAFPPPKSPEEALAAFHAKPGFTVELAAAEPLVVDPVAIDWGADGRLWVVEMRDYPMGIDGHWKPGGRVKLLEDVDGDGRFDKATVFLDGLPFPTGILAWNKGALICAAPDILYAEDTHRDGKADVVKKLFTGFATENYQARVNSLSLGLDNWIYGANGLIGGTIRAPSRDWEIDIRGRDFRLRPDTGEFEPASGLTQQGRVRNDWGDWFGCDNSTLLWHYPLSDHYLRRNPSIAPPEPRVFVPADSDPNQLHPTSELLERFNDPGAAGRTTSACGLGIYRDELLGTNYSGNAFVCEPVHNLVHRLVLTPDGITFKGRRASDELGAEFLSSRDNWFRPVQARTGPDGALWIVDFYRFVVEHPRWIPPERLAQLDVRAGEDKGRIYRVFPSGQKPRPIRNLTRLSTKELVADLDTPNGTERDRVHLELIRRNDRKASTPLVQLVKTARTPAVRLQALCVLDGLRVLTPDLLESALSDAHPALRQHAIRLSEQFVPAGSTVPGSPRSARIKSDTARSMPEQTHLGTALLQLLNDPEMPVRCQLALTLGDWDDPRAGEGLAQLAKSGIDDEWMRAALLSSANRFPAVILRSVLTATGDSSNRQEMIDQLIATAAGQSSALGEILAIIAPTGLNAIEPWRLNTLAGLLDVLNRKGRDLGSLSADSGLEARQALDHIKQAIAEARSIAQNRSSDEATRIAATGLLGHTPERFDFDLVVLKELLVPPASPPLQAAALSALVRTRSPKAPGLLLTDWSRHSPSLRNAILASLIARDEWIEPLFGAIEKGVVATAEIPPANRQRLLKNRNQEIAKRASALLAEPPASSRSDVLARYQEVLKLTGDPVRGGTIFATNCSSCHSLAGQGHAVGPDLTAFRTKGPQDYLVAILDPNAAVEPRFINYQIQTKDGRSLSGVIKAETAAGLTVAQSGGLEEKILQSDIVEIKAASLSLMPEGLEQTVTPQDLADLIAWLKRAGPPTP